MAEIMSEGSIVGTTLSSLFFESLALEILKMFIENNGGKNVYGVIFEYAPIYFPYGYQEEPIQTFIRIKARTTILHTSQI